MVTRELLERIREQPVINHTPLPEYGYDHLDYGMAQGIERTRGGRLWSCWVGGGDSPAAFLVVAHSDDDGEHWTEPDFVVDPHRLDLPYERCSRVGMLWCDPAGRLWFFFQQTFEMFDGCASNWYVRCDNPDAGEPIWTEPTYVGVGASINKPIVLSNGDWMLPVSLWERWHVSEPFRHCFHELDPVRGASVFVSFRPGRHLGMAWLRDLPGQRIQRTHGSGEDRQRGLDAVSHQVRHRREFLHRLRPHLEQAKAILHRTSYFECLPNPGRNRVGQGVRVEQISHSPPALRPAAAGQTRYRDSPGKRQALASHRLPFG